MNVFISNDKAGYANKIPSGTLTPAFIAYTVNAATKFPPALSPTNTTLFGATLKYWLTNNKMNKYAYQQSSKPAGYGFSGATL